MYDFSSGFGVINNAFANIGKQNELAFKQRALAELGKDINAGNYASAAQKAIASGDASLGVSLLGLGQKAQEKAAEAEWLRRNGGIADVGAAAPAGGAPLARLGQSGYTPRPTIATTEEEVQALEGSTGTPGQKVAARLVNNGLTPVAAAGVAGNLNAESRFRTTAVNPRDGRDGSDSVGMAQWNGPRAQALQQFAASQGKDWRDPNVQADFVAYELRTTEGRTGAALDQAQTPQQAGAAAIGFFRPQGYTAANPMGALGAGQRVASANQFVVGGEVAPPAGAFAPEATQVAQAPAQPGQPIADAPAPGAAQAQGFVIPGTSPQQTQSIMGDAQVRAARQRFIEAPTERTRAVAKQELDLAIADAKTRQAQNAPTDVQRNYAEARRQGYAGTLLDYQKELRAQTNVNVNGGEKTYDSTVGKAYGEQFVEIQKGGRDASKTIGTINMMERLIQTPGFYSGFGGEKSVAANRALVALGVKDPKAASAQEAFQALSNQIVLDASGGSLGAQISNGDRDYINATAPNLANTPEGNKQLLSMRRQLAERQTLVAKMARDYAKSNGGRIDSNFEQQLADFTESNPLFPPLANAAPAVAPPPPPPAAPPPQRPAAGTPRTATNPNTGERIMLTPDGQWVPYS